VLFPQVRFDAEATEKGRDALGWYHEKRDQARGIGLGPEHDWASHGADAFGLGCVIWAEPTPPKPKAVVHRQSGGAGGWMA
jgi:phage terminase large subunit